MSLTPTDQLREAKLRLASEIENQLATFTKLTGLRVDSIDVSHLGVNHADANHGHYLVSLLIYL